MTRRHLDMLDMDGRRVIPVEIICPQRLFQRTLYRLCDEITLAGVTVPAGFITDGVTSPRILWWLYPPVGRYFAAAAVHDYLLQMGIHWRVANDAFRRALIELGLPRPVVTSMYAAVQVYQYTKHVLMPLKK